MKGRLAALLAAPTAWLVLFLAVPSAVIALKAFSAEGLDHLADRDMLALLAKSLAIAAIVTAACLVLGYPLAWFIAGSSRGWKAFLLLLVVLPFWTNLLVRTFALNYLLRPLGLYLTLPGAVIGLVHAYLPYMILPLYVSIEKLPPRLLEAAQDLGASPWQAFWRVSVPLTMPGVAAGCILVFIPVLGSFATPELLGGASATMFGSLINLYFMKAENLAAGSALTLILTGLTVALTWLYHRVRKSEGLV